MENIKRHLSFGLIATIGSTEAVEVTGETFGSYTLYVIYILYRLSDNWVLTQFKQLYIMNIPATGVIFDIYILHFLNCLTVRVTFGAYNVHHELSLRNVSIIQKVRRSEPFML